MAKKIQIGDAVQHNVWGTITKGTYKGTRVQHYVGTPTRVHVIEKECGGEYVFPTNSINHLERAK